LGCLVKAKVTEKIGNIEGPKPGEFVIIDSPAKSGLVSHFRAYISYLSLKSF
ncbi:hypothetical protein H0H87_004888, partial [Tephrocybe sp. NHM501043]